MLPVADIYTDVTVDNAASIENGDLSFAAFSRMSRRAELRMLDYVTGSVADASPPAIYLTEKIRGFASPFIKKKPYNVENGIITLEDDFYLYSGFEVINSSTQADCETGEQFTTDEPEGTIEVLDPLVFTARKKTYIKRLKPTASRAIAQRIGKTFEFYPKDLGTVELSYFRYPVFAEIVAKQDDVFNNEIIDEAKSTDYEWPEWSRNLLVWFITDTYALRNRESALMQANKAVGPSAREEVGK